MKDPPLCFVANSPTVHININTNVYVKLLHRSNVYVKLSHILCKCLLS